MRARWTPVLLMAAVSAPAWGQAQLQNHFPLTAAQVAQALSAQGTPTTEKQVSLLAKVVATKGNPALDIVSVEPLGKGQIAQPPRSRVKLACRLPGECLPFYAIVSSPEATTSPKNIAPSTSTFAKKRVPLADVTMRIGTHATLVMDDHRVHIQVAVITLENGMAGDTIRVTSPDHKQAYFGKVVNANLLKGSF